MSQFAGLINDRRRIAIALFAVIIVALVVIFNPFQSPSKSSFTESDLVKATGINPSSIPKPGIPASELEKYKEAIKPTAQGIDTDNNQEQQPSYVQADNVQAPQIVDSTPFDEKPAVIAMNYYAPAKMPASLAETYLQGSAPRPVPIEEVIEQRQRLAKGEVLHTVGVIKKPPLMPRTKADVEKIKTQQQKFQDWWQVNNSSAN